MFAQSTLILQRPLSKQKLAALYKTQTRMRIEKGVEREHISKHFTIQMLNSVKKAKATIYPCVHFQTETTLRTHLNGYFTDPNFEVLYKTHPPNSHQKI